MAAPILELAPRNIKLILEYDGTGLSGWQRQADGLTVQGLLEQALGRITGHMVTVHGAGRTDAGVHAKGQVANFSTRSARTCQQILRGGNALLPSQITILSAKEVPADFHARYQAKSKIYDYDLFLSPVRPALRRDFVWHLPMTLNLKAMTQALNFVLGEHDFAAFQSVGTPVHSTIRRLWTAQLSQPLINLVRISLEADGFLRHMVRAIVGTLVLVGQGRLTPLDFQQILLSADRSRAGPTAPARGLCLRQVRYANEADQA